MKQYKDSGEQVLGTVEGLDNFVAEVLNGQRKEYWTSTPDCHDRASVKVVGDDFEKQVIDRDVDTLMLIYHPQRDKNRGLKEKFDRFARENSSEELQIARMNGVN